VRSTNDEAAVVRNRSAGWEAAIIMGIAFYFDDQFINQPVMAYKKEGGYSRSSSFCSYCLKLFV